MASLVSMVGSRTKLYLKIHFEPVLSVGFPIFNVLTQAQKAKITKKDATSVLW